MTEQLPTHRVGETGHTDYAESTSTAAGEAGEASMTRPADPETSDASMKDKAAESAQAGREAVGQIAGTAGEKAQDVAVEARQQATKVWGTAQDQLREQAGVHHRNAIDALRSLGDELSSMTGNVSESGPAAQLARQAADRSHRAAGWLDQREPGDLVQELRSFAGRRPGTFLLGAMAAGIAAGRLTRGAVAAHSEDSRESGS